MAAGRRSSDRLRFPLLAGWLFADLFVVLFIISLASGAVTPAGPGTASPGKGAAHRAPAPVVSATPGARPASSASGVLEGTLVTKYVPVSTGELQALYADPADDSLLLNGLLDQLTSRQKAQRAGFVQLFLPGADSGLATTVAEEVVDELPAQDPAMFGGAARQGLWHGDTGTAEFQIFFVA